MALDHYVSQVHLKQFNNADGVLHATLKQSQKTFTNHSRAFCRIDDNSTNEYLSNKRAIEELLKIIEPKYDASLEKFRLGNPDPESVYVFAGFIASMMWYSPAGVRINKDPIERTLNEVGRRLDRQGKMPRAPDSMGGGTFSEMLDRGAIELNVNPKYPQAIGTTTLRTQIFSFGNFDWEILTNPFPDNAFFTSDYPVGIEPKGNQGIIDRVVPLAPDIAVRICPKPIDDEKIQDNFAGFRYRTLTLKRQEVVAINRLIVRCAESIVFYPKQQPWISDFIKTNAGFRIEPKTTMLHYDGGTCQISTSEISGNTA